MILKLAPRWHNTTISLHENKLETRHRHQVPRPSPQVQIGRVRVVRKEAWVCYAHCTAWTVAPRPTPQACRLEVHHFAVSSFALGQCFLFCVLCSACVSAFRKNVVYVTLFDLFFCMSTEHFAAPQRWGEGRA